MNAFFRGGLPGLALTLLAGTACDTLQKKEVVQGREKATLAVAKAAAKVQLDPLAADIPEPQREFRAAWVATVANIDWPSKKDLSTAEQQAELIAILDKAKELNLNALIFQARPACDALYQSDIEPWSEYLTGAQGKAPEPFYDPLEMWVTEAHKRGIELHVWFNPYRAWHPSAKGEPAANSILKTKPGIVRELKGGYWWMDPAEPETIQHSLDVVVDVTRRYDIDGVHFDDYFYPYQSYNGDKDFPDDESWGRYQAGGGTMTRNDWRRDAVNRFVKSIHEQTHATRATTKFGMSPFGIWRPGHPESIAGMDQYDVLYADAKLWLNEGWVDYWTPQLYWPIRQIPQSFPVLLQWWADQNTQNRHLWVGMGSYRAGEDKWGTKDEVLSQVQVTRAIAKDGPGQVHFSFKTLQFDKAGVATALKEGPYRKPALVPATPWLDAVPPLPPVTTADSGTNTVSWSAAPGEAPFVHVVYTKADGKWSYDIVPATVTSYQLPAEKTETVTTDNIQGGTKTTTKTVGKVTHVSVTSVDRSGNESQRVVVVLK